MVMFSTTYRYVSVRTFIAHDKLPHLLFYGPPGTGKTRSEQVLILNICLKNQNLQNSFQKSLIIFI